MQQHVLWFHVFTFYFKFGRGTGLFSHEFNLTHSLGSNRLEQEDIGSTWNKKRKACGNRNPVSIRKVHPGRMSS